MTRLLTVAALRVLAVSRYRGGDVRCGWAEFLRFPHLCVFLYLHQVRLRRQLLAFTVSVVLFILFFIKMCWNPAKRFSVA